MDISCSGAAFRVHGLNEGTFQGHFWSSTEDKQFLRYAYASSLQLQSTIARICGAQLLYRLASDSACKFSGEERGLKAGTQHVILCTADDHESILYEQLIASL